MLIKCPYATLYLITIVMFSLSVAIAGIFALKMCMTLTFLMCQGQIQNVLFESQFAICYCLQDIHSRNVHDLDLDI